jgi:hypothetical protein
MKRLAFCTVAVAAVFAATASAPAAPAGPCLPPGIKLPAGSPKLPACKTTTPQSPPQTFVGKYHLSGYGVYHEQTVWSYTEAPCQTGGKGGGTNGTLRNDTTIRWETVRPATVTVQGILGNVSMVPALDPATGAPGAITTVTVTSKVIDNRTRTSCDLAGDPIVSDEPGKADRTVCGTHTYTAGYYMGTHWPRVFVYPGQRIAVGVAPLPGTGTKLPDDWGRCWSTAVQISALRGDDINAPLPFADLPRRIRGKLSVIARGGKVTQDSNDVQNTGGTVHYHVEFNGTSYVTWVRIG